MPRSRSPQQALHPWLKALYVRRLDDFFCTDIAQGSTPPAVPYSAPQYSYQPPPVTSSSGTALSPTTGTISNSVVSPSSTKATASYSHVAYTGAASVVNVPEGLVFGLLAFYMVV